MALCWNDRWFARRKNHWFFEHTIEKNLILASFIPLVVYIADAVGTQLEAFAIRDFVLFRHLDFTKYFLKQLATVSIVAMILGVSMTAFAIIFYGQTKIALILGIGIICATFSALFSGLFVPYLFRKLKLDPANASGPIRTIIQDILSIIIYFTVASAII